MSRYHDAALPCPSHYTLILTTPQENRLDRILSEENDTEAKESAQGHQKRKNHVR